MPSINFQDRFLELLEACLVTAGGAVPAMTTLNWNDRVLELLGDLNTAIAGIGVGGGFPTPDYDSGQVSFTNGSVVSVSHGLGVVPSRVEAQLECVTAEVGYSIGDVVMLATYAYYDTGGNSSAGAALVSNSTTLYCPVSTNGFVFQRRDTAANTNLTASRWRIRFRAWS